jgi:nucleoside-diphosphate-sugar epimerase
MRIFVTGACGYKGSVLVPKLLARGHEVIAFDTMWFGNYLAPHPNLAIVRGDVRNTEEIRLDGVDAIIHLASIGHIVASLMWNPDGISKIENHPYPGAANGCIIR